MTVTESNFAPFYFLMAFWLLGIDANLGTSLEKNDAKQQFPEILYYFSGFKQLKTKGKLDLPCIVNYQ